MYSVGGRQDYKAILSQMFDKAVNPQKIQSDLKEIARWGAAYIYSASPYKTGFLASETDCQVVGPYSILLESKAPYSDYLNSGTSRIKPTFYFDRSAQAINDKIHDVLKMSG